jgi:hypothetical protein
MKTNLINSSFYFDKYELSNKPSNAHENSVENPFTEPKFQGAKVSKFSIQPRAQNVFLSNKKNSSPLTKESNTKHAKSQSCIIFKKEFNIYSKGSKYRLLTKNYFFYQFHKVKCFTLFFNRTFRKHSHFVLAHKYINTLIDINSYLSLFKEMLIFKHFFFNSNQLFRIAHLRKFYLFKELVFVAIIASTIAISAAFNELPVISPAPLLVIVLFIISLISEIFIIIYCVLYFYSLISLA